MGFFIVFEGGDGAGKTTVATALYRKLHRERYPVVLTQEPGGTWPYDPRELLTLPESWRSGSLPLPYQPPLMVGPLADHTLPEAISEPATPWVELLFWMLARAQLVAEVIRPHLSRGVTVICDRFAPSSVAYQGYARGLDPRLIEAANTIAAQGLKPDLIVLLDIAPEIGIARKQSNRDRFEREKVAFHRRVREGYLEMARADPQRWLVVDASQPRSEVTKIIWARVSQLLSQRRP